jgi:Kef-type K+ transport system membrane component KefB
LGATPDDRSRSPAVPGRPGHHHPARPAVRHGGQAARPAAGLGEIIAGILLGPTLLHGKITATLFPITLSQPLSALANLGVLMFMFAVGYLLDLRLIRGRERVAASVSVSSIILPLSLGVGLGVWLASHNHVHQVLPFALFVGTAMSVTAFPVLARILTDRGMHRTRIGGIALASAAIDNVLA